MSPHPLPPADPDPANPAAPADPELADPQLQAAVDPVLRIAPADLHRLARRSLVVLRAGQHRGGAFVAAPTFAAYRHAWLRDGAFCAWAMGEAGHPDRAEAFFRWTATTIRRHSGDDGPGVASPDTGRPRGSAYLPARFDVDGRRLDDGWWDRQHDGYGTWLVVAARHERRYGPLPPELRPGITATVRYLLRVWRQPCFDWWEENDGHRHVATLLAVAGGLQVCDRWSFLPTEVRSVARRAAHEIRDLIVDRGVIEGRLRKWLEEGPSGTGSRSRSSSPGRELGRAVDAALLAGAVPLGVFEATDPVFTATVAEVENRLLCRAGVHRHPADTFYGGGTWPLLTGLLGLQYAELGRTDDAWHQLRRLATQATADGDLPEQVRGHLLFPDRRAEWLDRWGEPASPLLWSHAMYLLLALRLGAVSPAELVEPP